jgi:hypothetical protein
MEKYNIDSDEIWEVHGSTWVVKHKALERVAVDVGVVWLKPEVHVCDPIGKIAVICAYGKLGDREEWSFGEASPANNKNSYAVAMAEKRARDRVILKLLVSHGALYSESEADEFTQPRQNPHVTRPADIVPSTDYDEHGEVIDNVPHGESSGKKLRVVDQRPIFEALQKDAHAFGDSKKFIAWMNAETTIGNVSALKPDWQEIFRGLCKEHLMALRTQERGDDMRMAG